MENLSLKKESLPTKIGNYKIIGRLGRGGMGDIYKARQKSLDRVVALKVLLPQMGRSEEFSKRFEIEAKAISLLQHHNIVSIYEYGEEDGLKYFAMEFVDGVDLGQKISDSVNIDFKEIITISKQICRALRYAHKHNVIHRDIKPQNILIDNNGECKLSDFGIARIFQSVNLTMTGMAVGTPEYMSPEQAEGIDLQNQTDIYSLGVVIYEMITGIPPFTGNNPVSIAYKQVHELPLPPSVHRKNVPKRLELIVLKALKKNKMERYASIEGMLDDLDTVDINETSLKPTIPVEITKKKAKEKRNSVTSSNRRITDRRNGSRRNNREQGSTEFIELTKNSKIISFLSNSIKDQALSLSLILILAVVLFLHIFVG